jgi:hypothetical protein
MATRKVRADVETGIPPALYWGLAPGAFPYFGHGDPRSDRSVYRHRQFREQARVAGYFVLDLKKKAQTDSGFQRWLTEHRHDNYRSAR